MKTVRRPPYPKWNPGYFPCSSLTPLPLSSRRPSVSFGGFGLSIGDPAFFRRRNERRAVGEDVITETNFALREHVRLSSDINTRYLAKDSYPSELTDVER